jgi:hypothetical protein
LSSPFSSLNLSLHKLLWFSLSFHSVHVAKPFELSFFQNSSYRVLSNLFSNSFTSDSVSFCFSHYFPITPHFCSCYPTNMQQDCSYYRLINSGLGFHF